MAVEVTLHQPVAFQFGWDGDGHRLVFHQIVFGKIDAREVVYVLERAAEFCRGFRVFAPQFVVEETHLRVVIEHVFGGDALVGSLATAALGVVERDELPVVDTGLYLLALLSVYSVSVEFSTTGVLPCVVNL